ncbi:hypothetical protein SSX86_021405 [Deinandra increscens subsp. villosa]|uniref:Cathepsin propeptide inhibitor domain-containing protein n=1 Tax=Deinandra increscens subsp. villosa TaxID=3103831 RepID=A0AAP0CWT4_9ASTR
MASSSSFLQNQKQLWKKSRSLLDFSRRIAGFSSSSSSVRTRTDDEVRALFEEWAIKHGKKYEDPEEKEMRFRHYSARLRQFELHHNPDLSFTPMLDTYAANHFTGGVAVTWHEDGDQQQQLLNLPACLSER